MSHQEGYGYSPSGWEGGIWQGLRGRKHIKRKLEDPNFQECQFWSHNQFCLKVKGIYYTILLRDGLNCQGPSYSFLIETSP